jgi:AcrR family transcriptional regulator
MMEEPIKRKDIPPQRREQVLAAARELFSHGGYYGVTVEAIAEKAGISKGNLYWYFKSKREIFQLLFDDIGERLFAPFAEVMESDAPPREKLRAFASCSLDSAEANKEAIYLMWQIAAQPELQELLTTEYSMMLDPFIDYLTPLFTEIGERNPENTAMLYAFTLDTLAFVAVVGPEFFNRDRMMAALEEKFIGSGREKDG